MPWGRADTGSPDLAEAYRQHREEIYRYLFGKTHDREQAEDLTQEVFTAALVARPTLAGDSGSLLPWLYVVARRRYIDSRRHNLTTGRCVCRWTWRTRFQRESQCLKGPHWSMRWSKRLGAYQRRSDGSA